MKVGDVLELLQLATPAGNPPAGSAYLYIKADGFLYYKNSSGVESKVDITGGAGGAFTPNNCIVSADFSQPASTSVVNTRSIEINDRITYTIGLGAILDIV